jgi:hypothetical protein
MIELTGNHFERLCASAELMEPIGQIEEQRRAAVRQFFLRGGIGLALAIGAAVTLFRSGWTTMAVIAFIGFFIVTLIAALAPLSAAKEGLKLPALEAVAREAGMEYFAADFSPPIFNSAAALLFGGGGFSSATFTDLFNGADSEGRGEAAYEACLQRRTGKNTHTVFSGQIYAIQRRPEAKGYTVAVPDRKIFNFWKPASDMERVTIEGDSDFEKRFEIYSTEPMEARRLYSDAAFRARLLELRKAGRIFVYSGPEEALVAVSGKNRFEPGSMFRSSAGRDRVRLMFDDVCASLRLLSELKAKLG